MTMLPDAEALCAKLITELKPIVTPATAMIGLYTGGAWLAEKLHPQLGLSTPLGLMDIAFYRDDYHKQGLHHDPKRTKIGFEVSFTRHFYQPPQLRSLAQISADILALELETEGLLHEITKGAA